MVNQSRVVTESWEQRKVLDLLIQPITDGPHETPELVDNGVPFISVDAIIDNRIDFTRKRGNITEEYDLLCCKKYKPELHDVYMVKSGSTTGKVAIVETTDRFNIWSPLAAMRCGGKTDPYYLYYLLQTQEVQDQVSDKASNGTQPNLSMRELEKFPVVVSSNIYEQKMIGESFRDLDNLITLHQRKHYRIRTSAPRNKTEPNPPHNTATWEQRKLSDIGDIITGTTPPTKDKDNYGGNRLFVSPADIQGNRYVITTNTTLTEKGYALGRELRGGTSLFVSIGSTIGKVAQIKDSATTNQQINAVVPSAEMDDDFVFTMLENEADKIKKLSAQQAVPIINKTTFGDTEIKYPKKEEQIRIGQFFASLDNLITLHQRNNSQYFYNHFGFI